MLEVMLFWLRVYRETLLIEKKIRGGLSSVMGDRYVEPDEIKKKLYIDANNLYGWVMSEALPYKEIKFHRNVNLENMLITLDDSDIGYLIENDQNILII